MFELSSADVIASMLEAEETAKKEDAKKEEESEMQRILQEIESW